MSDEDLFELFCDDITHKLQLRNFYLHNTFFFIKLNYVESDHGLTHVLNMSIITVLTLGKKYDMYTMHSEL